LLMFVFVLFRMAPCFVELVLNSIFKFLLDPTSSSRVY